MKVQSDQKILPRREGLYQTDRVSVNVSSPAPGGTRTCSGGDLAPPSLQPCTGSCSLSVGSAGLTCGQDLASRAHSASV